MTSNHFSNGTLVRGLGLVGASMLVIGSVIGSGIFIAPSLMAGYIRNPFLLILLWGIGGVFTLCGALSYAELAAAMPHSGGQYVFLREAFGPLWGFLYGWTLILVIQTGFIAAVAVAFAKYLGVFLPVFSESKVLFSLGSLSISAAQIGAILCIAALTAVNICGVRSGAWVQNVFTALKLAALAALALLGFALGHGSFKNFLPSGIAPVPETLKMGFYAAFAVAMSKALFAYDAWNSVTFAAEEVEDPHRNLPLSLIIGTLVVTTIYILVNLAYLYLVPAGEMSLIPDNRIGAVAAKAAMGSAGLIFITAAVLISTAGCDNGLILSGARVTYAMAKDGLFFKPLKKLHPAYRTPVNSLIVQGLWAALLTLSGSYSDLLTYVTFASLVFNAMTVWGIFVLRKKRPELKRPYLAWGYPWTPALYIAIAAFFILYIFIGDVKNSMKGLALVALGVPVYLAWKNKASA